MTANIKRGFNRIYIVLTVLWAFYCVILFPLQRQAEATRQFDRDLPVCSEYGEKDPACLGVKENWNTSNERWQSTVAFEAPPQSRCGSGTASESHLPRRIRNAMR
jgi:hypothetical protein